MTSATPQPEREYAARIADGAQVQVVGYAAGMLSLVCDCAHPPGRPLELRVQVGADAALVLQGKSAGSKRREDQRFDVRLRLHSLRREDRARLEQLFQKG
jgi:hypothetical protein